MTGPSRLSTTDRSLSVRPRTPSFNIILLLGAVGALSVGVFFSVAENPVGSPRLAALAALPGVLALLLALVYAAAWNVLEKETIGSDASAFRIEHRLFGIPVRTRIIAKSDVERISVEYVPESGFLRASRWAYTRKKPSIHVAVFSLRDGRTLQTSLNLDPATRKALLEILEEARSR